MGQGLNDTIASKSQGPFCKESFKTARLQRELLELGVLGLKVFRDYK